MSKAHIQLPDFIEKALLLSADCLNHIANDNAEKLLETLENRDRVINIINSLHENVTLEQTQINSEYNDEFNNQLNQLITVINQIDEKVLTYLHEEREIVQNEIAKTFKNKENLKGYNLNSLK